MLLLSNFCIGRTRRAMAGSPDGGGGAAAAGERAALLKSAERKLSKRILPCLSLLSIIW